MTYAVSIIWGIWIVVLLIFFHKIFDVYYFSGSGLFKELFWAALLGLVMAGLTIYLWPLTVIIIIILGLCISKKNSNSAVLVACVILSVVIAVIGIRAKKMMREEEIAESQNIDEPLDTYLEHEMSKSIDYPNENGMEDTHQGDDMSESNDYRSENKTDDNMTGMKGYDFQDNIEHESSDAASSDYILENSDSQYLTRLDLDGLSANDCRLARNELYARHGRKFDSKDLQNYFDSCSWYHGVIEPEDFQESMLNDVETANRDLIVEYEKEIGYR